MTNWIKGTCRTNGINIHYTRTGGAKPPVVLLHGLMLNGACWSTLARDLQENYDVIMPDARGHGDSSATEDGYTYDNLAADVAGLIKGLELVNPILIGHSMGGMTAAVVGGCDSLKLGGLILADPTFLTPQRQLEVHRSNIAEQHRRILNQPREDYLAEMLSRPSSRSREMTEQFAQARFQTNVHAFKILTPPNPDYMKLIATLNVKTLLVTGDVGVVVTPEIASELVGLNQYLQTIQIVGAGHAVPFDQPQQFSTVVQAFLGSLRRRFILI